MTYPAPRFRNPARLTDRLPKIVAYLRSAKRDSDADDVVQACALLRALELAAKKMVRVIALEQFTPRAFDANNRRADRRPRKTARRRRRKA